MTEHKVNSSKGTVKQISQPFLLLVSYLSNMCMQVFAHHLFKVCEDVHMFRTTLDHVYEETSSGLKSIDYEELPSQILSIM